jgi:hypothetical protein
MAKNKKFIPASLFVLTILLVIFMSASLSQVEFQPGTINEKNRDEINLIQINYPKLSSPIFFYLLICVIWVVLPVSIILFIKYPDVRKRTIQNLGYVAIYGLILFLLSRKTQEDSTEIEEIENELIDSTIIETQRKASEFISSTAEADPNINIILNIILIILIGIMTWYLYRRFIFKSTSTTKQLKTEVEGAIDEIKSGIELRNVIIRCYIDMSHILDKNLGLQRGQSMTPREFASQLQKIGLPDKPIERLTRLFESVRYGKAQLSSDTEQEALQCLSAIADECQNDVSQISS